MTFEKAQEALSEFADKLPEKIFEGLNGGIILLPDIKTHPECYEDELYILGEYCNHPYGLGRYIKIYYGSLEQVWIGDTHEEKLKRLRDVLYHELTHHLENLAGDKSLERQDDVDLDAYKRRYWNLN